ILVNACEQSDNHWLPQLLEPTRFSDLRLTGQTIVAHPATTTATVDPLESSLLLIGPEGGFSDEEVQTLLKKQVKPMSLGPRILRAETAAIVGLTLLGQQYGQF
ncbi:MAG: RNA methyltransferase, partial [Litoricola sp.]|nr:RNA methyltransferase [Litorivicinus sp.]